MHIQRIQVPNFRALKNVDITFEKEFTPRIFPLGSQNGGGKSTLLQLIFVLLHCSGNPDRVEFIQNLLDGFQVNDESGKRTLAIIDIWDGNKTVTLDFFICNESYIVNSSLENYGEHLTEEINVHDFSENLPIIKHEISNLEDKLFRLNKVLEQGKEEINKLPFIVRNSPELRTRMEELISQIEIVELELNEKNDKKHLYRQIFTQFLIKYDSLSIFNHEFISIDDELIDQSLVCKFDGIDILEANEFLKELSNTIFLTAHISQIFLFLQPDNRRSLFKTQENNQTNYYQQIKVANSKLPGFFTYDFLSIDILIASFKKAQEDDFAHAVKQGGNYGNNYVKLLDELNNLLSNKKINVQPDLSGINFKRDGDETELYPEDLSHGELKRLCIYMWLKHNKIEDAIVLMDELEISFHPDWQYQIVRDLEEWGATNQYILATHSYELCNAVSPAHV